MISGMQGKIKESGLSLGLISLKAATGLMVGLTFALIFRELMTVGNFLFTFTIVLFGVAFLRISQKWQFTGVLLFNLFCIMTALLLRMYILIAPGE
jgi:hypothetical protein